MSDTLNHPEPERLQAFVEASLDGEAAAAVDAHVASCSLCEGEVEQLRSLFEMLSGLAYHAPAAGFVDRVMTQVRVRQPWFAWAEQWAREWAERLTPKSTRALALTSALVALPAIAMAALVWWVLSRPGVSVQSLWVIGTDVAERATASMVTWLWSHVAGSSLAAWASSTAELVGSLGRGGVGLAAVMFATLTAASIWILYQNLFRTEGRRSDYASYVF
ncbi:MAG TPA: hypothetical protein VMM83_07145 [Longimicrobiales bacterium]|nr:hypothetical protein [Longimicrobiales bacterium]